MQVILLAKGTMIMRDSRCTSLSGASAARRVAVLLLLGAVQVSLRGLCRPSCSRAAAAGSGAGQSQGPLPPVRLLLGAVQVGLRGLCRP